MEDTPIAERRVPRATILIAQSSRDNHELFNDERTDEHTMDIVRGHKTATRGKYHHRA